MAKLLLDEILEVQKSVLDNLSNISIVAVSENQMIEVNADGNRKITAIHINEEILKSYSLHDVQTLLIETVNRALDMSQEAEARETNRMMDVFSPAIFDSIK
ncbi:MAG: YbaB/EbfC family DNA-binding protein [Bacteroidetes bacterium]|nr:YbaB/EbfC family DNA-binding protein [Bacteroidota bacterium]